MTTAVNSIKLKRFILPQTAIARFVARHNILSSTFWALLFGGIIVSKATSYASAYPTTADKMKVAETFGNNAGLNALIGQAHSLNTVVGFTEWNVGSIVLIGSIWALLLGTKVLRGEENSGRWEILLAGQTTARKAAVNAIAGLMAGLFIMYSVMSAVFIATGRIHDINFTTSAALFFGLAAVAGPLMFLCVGVLCAELMPTRARASGLAVVIFGLSFILRAAADTTSLHWLRNISPLGWIENLQPLFASQAMWLVPIIVFTVTVLVATVLLAQRDLNDSIFADKDRVKARLKLLGSPLALAYRLTRNMTIGWLLMIAFIGFFFGTTTKSASQLFNSSSGQAERIFNNLARSNAIHEVIAKAFMGIVFLLIMILMMNYVASALGAIREAEAEGYVNNLLVQPVSRLRWIVGRVGLVWLTVILAALVGFLASWIGEASQHTGLSFSSLFEAGVNSLAPAILSLGIGVLCFGFLPRLTTLVAYSVVAWSFLLDILESGIKLNHWILDTSVFTHVSFAPAVSPNWSTFFILISIGVVLTLLGITRFCYRDIT